MNAFRRAVGGFLGAYDTSIFATDEAGATVYFPSGLLKQGYVVTAEQEAAIRRFFKRFNIAVLLAVITGAKLFGWAVLLLALPAQAIIWWWSRRLIAGLPLSQFRMTSIEAQQRSIRLYGRRSTILPLAFAVAATIVGIMMLWKGAFLEGLFVVALFGYAAFQLSSFLIRNRQYSPDAIEQSHD
jgi:hypothetical protein